MMESFTNMQALLSFAERAQGDFSYRWYGLRFTEVITYAPRHHRVYSPVSPENWKPIAF
jgi:hypothetical protein